MLLNNSKVAKYLYILKSLYSLSDTQFNVLLLLISEVNHDSTVIINRKLKYMIIEKCSITEGTVKNILTLLVRNKLITRTSKQGIYKLSEILMFNTLFDSITINIVVSDKGVTCAVEYS